MIFIEEHSMKYELTKFLCIRNGPRNILKALWMLLLVHQILFSNITREVIEYFILLFEIENNIFLQLCYY